MQTNFASRYTRIAAGQTDSAIVSRETVRIHGIVIVSSAVASVTILEGDGTTVITTMNVLANTTFELKTGFIAHRGLSVTTDANASCTVFHSHGSA